VDAAPGATDATAGGATAPDAGRDASQDECSPLGSSCGYNDTCVDVGGVYRCQCPVNFKRGGPFCWLDECATGTAVCSVYAQCMDRADYSAYECPCSVGFSTLHSSGRYPYTCSRDATSRFDLGLWNNSGLGIGSGPGMLVDSSGNTVVFMSRDRDKQVDGQPHESAFVAKYAPDGTRLWLRDVAEARSLAIDSHGSIAVAGWAYSQEVVLTLLDPQGGQQLDVRYPNPMSLGVFAMTTAIVAFDDYDNLYLGGDFFGTLTLDGFVLAGGAGFWCGGRADYSGPNGQQIGCDGGDFFLASIGRDGSVTAATSIAGYGGAAGAARPSDQRAYALVSAGLGVALLGDYDGTLQLGAAGFPTSQGNMQPVLLRWDGHTVLATEPPLRFARTAAAALGGKLALLGIGGTVAYRDEVLQLSVAQPWTYPSPGLTLRALAAHVDGSVSVIGSDGPVAFAEGSPDVGNVTEFFGRLDAAGVPLWAHYGYGANESYQGVSAAPGGSVRVLVDRYEPHGTTDGYGFAVETIDPPP
jgi:hypothetical protein